MHVLLFLASEVHCDLASPELPRDPRPFDSQLMCSMLGLIITVIARVSLLLEAVNFQQGAHRVLLTD